MLDRHGKPPPVVPIRMRPSLQWTAGFRDDQEALLAVRDYVPADLDGLQDAGHERLRGHGKDQGVFAVSRPINQTASHCVHNELLR